MTTNVPKGAGRATATAKRNKHAQHTPLPPRKGSPGAEAIEERKAEIEAAEPEKPMGEWTVTRLRRSARFKGISGAHAMTKGQLLNAHLEWERAAKKTTERLSGKDTTAEVFAVAEKSKPARPARQPKGKPEPEVKAECTGDVDPATAGLTEGAMRSISKAEMFLEAAAALGWAEKARSSPEQDSHGIIVGRGEERIVISWRNGVFVGEECFHSHPARSPRKVINASAAKKIMSIPPAVADEEARKVSANKAARPRRDRAGEATTAARKPLPFDPEASSDEDVLKAVRNKKLSWTNEVSGMIEDAFVTGEPSIQPGRSGRSVRFTSMTGFRSVRVSSIVAVR